MPNLNPASIDVPVSLSSSNEKKNTSVVLEDIYPVNYIIYKATLKNTMFRLPFLPCLITGE